MNTLWRTLKTATVADLMPTDLIVSMTLVAVSCSGAASPAGECQDGGGQAEHGRKVEGEDEDEVDDRMTC